MLDHNKSGNDVIGVATIPLVDVTERPDFEISGQVFKLDQASNPQASITVTAKLYPTK